MIIENWTKRPAWVRRFEWILSAAMWLLYLYFIREALIDLYDLAIDVFEWVFAGDERPYLAAITRFLATLRIYGIIILLNGAALVTWALYNQLRFRGHDRHRPRPVIGVAELASLYGRPMADIAEWQQSRILVMHHGPDGTLTEVVSATPKDLSLAREAGATIGSEQTAAG